MRFALLKKQQYLKWIAQAPTVADPELPEGYDHETAVRAPGYYQDAYNEAAMKRSQTEIWICLGLSCHPDSVIDYSDVDNSDKDAFDSFVADVERCDAELSDFCRRREILFPTRRMTGESLIARGKMIAELAESGDCMDEVITFRDTILFDVFGFVRQEVVAENMKSEANEGQRNGLDGSGEQDTKKTRNAKNRIQRPA